MLQALRSRSVALATLAAFLVAQPAALCAALCLFERHDPAVRSMLGMDHGTPALHGGVCHSGVTDAAPHSTIEVLSPMAPARAVVIVAAQEHLVEPLWTLPTFPRPVFRTAEPPPPRFV